MQNNDLNNELLKQVKMAKKLALTQRKMVDKFVNSEVFKNMTPEYARMIEKARQMQAKAMNGGITAEEVNNFINKLSNDFDKK